MNKLSESTVRLISSSQVITSVYSVVKELIENSIDARATSIDVKLEEFGFGKIEVRDNGSGIAVGDTPYMAQRHYTSKIKDHTDLDAVSSYGFRGEALGSLCAMAEVSITTKTLTDSISTTYSLGQNGIINGSRPSHLEQGTTVTVSNLFKNLPVRKQYYGTRKQQSNELKKVETLVMAFGIIRPAIKLSLRHNKDIIWQKRPATNYIEALHSVMSSSIVKSLEQVTESFMDNNLKVEMFLPHPEGETEITKRTSADRIFIYINRRPVSDKQIEKIVKQYYQSATLSDKYPVGFVHLSLPAHLCDVNLEPNKNRLFIHNKELVLEKLGCVLEKLYGPLNTTAQCKPKAIDRRQTAEYVKDKSEGTVVDINVNHIASHGSPNKNQVGNDVNILTSQEPPLGVDNTDSSHCHFQSSTQCHSSGPASMAYVDESSITACDTYLRITQSGKLPFDKSITQHSDTSVISHEGNQITHVDDSLTMTDITNISNKTNDNTNTIPVSQYFDDTDDILLRACQDVDTNLSSASSDVDEIINAAGRGVHCNKAIIQPFDRDEQKCIVGRSVCVNKAMTIPDCVEDIGNIDSDNRVSVTISNPISEDRKESDGNASVMSAEDSVVEWETGPIFSNSADISTSSLESWSRGKGCSEGVALLGPTEKPSDLHRTTSSTSVVLTPPTGKQQPGNHRSLVRLQGKTTSELQELDRGQTTLYDIFGSQSVKRPQSSFIVFSKHIRPQISKENPSDSYDEISKMIGEKWNDMTEDEKFVYQEKHAEDILTYKEKVQDFKDKISKRRKISHPMRSNPNKPYDSNCSVRTESIVKFSIQAIRENVTKPKVIRDFLQSAVIGCVKSYNIWICLVEKHLMFLNYYRATEALVYRRLKETFDLTAEILPEPTEIRHSFLGDELWNTLQSLTITYNIPDPWGYLLDPRLIKNGLMIRVKVDDQDDITQQHRTYELYKVCNTVSFYGKSDLKEILERITEDNSVDVVNSRPIKVQHFLQTESVRMVRMMPHYQSKDDVLDVIKNVKLSSKTHCIHNRPIFHEINDIF